MDQPNSKPKYHCPMDRIARESAALEVPDRFFVDAFERSMAWQEQAFERDSNELPEQLKARMFLHVVEHAQTAIAEQFARELKVAARVFGVSEEAIERCITMDKISELIRGFGFAVGEYPEQRTPSVDKSKMEA